jgi:hypothetical protein
MQQIEEVLRAFGLTPAMGITALVLAVLLRYARGMLHWVTSEWTYILAILLGVGGSFLEAAQGQPWQATAKTATALACVVLLSQKALEKAAEVVPWLPKDNEWTAK